MDDIKITGLGEDTSPTTDDYTVSVDITSGTTKKVKWANLANLFQALVMPFVHPVNSIYITTVNEDPATTFGFGTWERYAKGSALVGVSDAGTFATPGVQVGVEAVTLTVDQMPVHSHGVYDPGHNHSSANGTMVALAVPSTNRLTLSGSAQQISWGNSSTSWNGSNIGIYNNGGGQSHTNIQPSMPVYVWKRTA